MDFNNWLLVNSKQEKEIQKVLADWRNKMATLPANIKNSIQYWMKKGYSVNDAILIVHDALYDTNYSKELDQKSWTPYDSPYYKLVWMLAKDILKADKSKDPKGNNSIINKLFSKISQNKKKEEYEAEQLFTIRKKTFLLIAAKVSIPSYEKLHHKDVTSQEVQKYYNTLKSMGIWDKYYNYMHKLYKDKFKANFYNNLDYNQYPSNIENAETLFNNSLGKN